jgi:hypothetical protein
VSITLREIMKHSKDVGAVRVTICVVNDFKALWENN